MKKIGLHIDALIVLVFILIGSLGFNLYQRYQYLDLLQAHIDLQWQGVNAEFGLSFAQAELKKCQRENSQQNGGTETGQDNP